MKHASAHRIPTHESPRTFPAKRLGGATTEGDSLSAAARSLGLFALSLALGVASGAHAQSGVSDDRVSLPDGPGSVEGIGANATMSGNMGSMSYAVPLTLPAGYASATPSLALSYDSGGGNGVVGMGWSIDAPSIERTTLRGYPRYVAADEFAADRSEQLVRVSTSGAGAVYRSRHEGGFVRRTWVDAGAAGYWKAETPDGSVHYFGARSDGTIVPEARLAGPSGETFRYHLVESVDLHGHRIRYDYALVDGMPYLAKIAYAFDAGGSVARYSVSLAYAARPDPISDAKPGFETRMTQRLVSVTIATAGETVRKYVLRYETLLVSGGLSRLVGVDTYGRSGGLYPASYTFGYSAALSADCGPSGCPRPYLVSMGTMAGAGGIRSGAAAIVDLDGDSLPDVVDTSLAGPHRIYRNRLVSEGHAHFDATPVLSATGTHSGFDASTAGVQEIDIDGDGFTDLVNLVARAALCNEGTGDWSTTGCSVGSALDLTLEADPTSPTDNDPKGTRFFDVDGDRRIDILRTDAIDSTVVRRNTAAGFQSMTVQPIGMVFDGDRLFLADVNGDNLLDPVYVGNSGAVSRRLNLGHGRWSDWKAIPGPTLSLDEANAAQLEDLDGDGLDDLVIVLFDRVRYALNRYGERFDPLVTIEAAGVDGGVPARSATTTVLFADMNATGSVDVVWVQSSGEVLYLELFPAPPNLLSRIDNGLGAVQEITYGTAVAARAADSTPWTYPLTTPTNVVVRIDAYTTTTGAAGGVGLHDVTSYRYRDGYYDGREKLLRGFARIEATSAGDPAFDSQEPGRVISSYDVGFTDVYRAGKVLSVRRTSGAGPGEGVLSEVRTTYGDCALAEVPADGLAWPVRYVCELEATTVHEEGAASSEWVTTRSQSTYDGYGQVTLAAELGIVSLGAPESPQACGACGADGSGEGGACGPGCLGDERYTQTAFLSPGAATGGRWILGRPQTVRTYGVEGGPATETRIHYDGQPFVGLPLGQLVKGDVSRVTMLEDAASQVVIETERSSYDSHGNVLVSLDPEGSPSDATAHRRSYAYDALGLRIVRTDVHVATPEGEPYRLRREYAYDAALDLVSEASSWMVVKGDAAVSARNATSYRHDEFGRRIAKLEPGDTDGSPTSTYAWELGSPTSRIVATVRSKAGQAPDVAYVICVDGLGREFQRRTRIAGESYRVTDHAVLNRRGVPIRVYEEHVATGSACDPTPPVGVQAESIRYDALGREVERTRPDGSVVRTQRSPLVEARYDEEDTNAGGEHADTPTVQRADGLGRIVSVERRLADGTAAATRAAYDSLGRLVAVRGAGGEVKRSAYDLLGRLVRIDDPVTGTTTFERDAAGNVVRSVDGRGIATIRSFDGANRPIAERVESEPEASAVKVRYDFGGACDARNCTNAAGRVVETTYPVGELVTSRLGGGAVGRDQRGYDARGRTVYDARAVAGTLFVTRHAFDAIGRRTETVHPDGRVVAYRYDGTSRVTSIDGVVESMDFDARGLATRIHHANGAEDTFEFDANRRETRRATLAASGTPLQDLAFERDRVGNLLRATDAAPTAPGFARRDATFRHDALYRVVEADFAAEDGTVETNRLSYDAGDDVTGSRSSRGASSPFELGELRYDAARPHTLVSAGGVAYAYDAAGYLVRRGDLELEWDAFGRLVRGSRGDELVAEFAYGAGTSRLATVEGEGITLYVTPDFEVRDGIAVSYVRLAGHRIARSESAILAPELLGDLAPQGSPDGAIDVADAWMAHAARTGIVPASSTPSADPSVTLRGAARRLLAEAGDGSVALHTDHLGNLVAATDASGAERGFRRFAVPNGENRSRGFVDVYGSFGQEEFPSLGLVRFEHRWLDVATRRWTRPDPLFQYVGAISAEHLGDLTNPYGYAAQSFVSLVDPTGLLSKAPLPRSQAGKTKERVTSLRDSIMRRALGSTNGGWRDAAARNCTVCASAFVKGTTSTEIARRTEHEDGVVRRYEREGFFHELDWNAEETPHADLEHAIARMEAVAREQGFETFILTFRRAGGGPEDLHSIAVRVHETGIAFHDAQNEAVDIATRRDGETIKAPDTHNIHGLEGSIELFVQPAERGR